MTSSGVGLLVKISGWWPVDLVFSVRSRQLAAQVKRLTFAPLLQPASAIVDRIAYVVLPKMI